MKLVTIVGARPQFIKCAAVSRVLRKKHTEILVHTGQHYDYGMSEVFFKELDIPTPDYNLGIGSGSHGHQTGAMLAAIEDILIHEEPDMLLVYGDTNSTVAGALAAAKLHIPVVHVEAGLRSFDRRMPEEINRVITDHLSRILFCPTLTAVRNLKSEGIVDGVYHVGDVMTDAVLFNRQRAEKQSRILDEVGVLPKNYVTATIHRPSNTDSADNMRAILEAFGSCGKTVVFPIHPRTRKYLHEYNLTVPENVILTDPLGYLDMLQVMANAERIITDSGGIQKEAYLLRVPCVTLRENTEWIETLDGGWNILIHSASTSEITKALTEPRHPDSWIPVFGEGGGAENIVECLEKQENPSLSA
ncbi:MAG: UDP-N-acetylglucosamine 2-epimerase (non-hydrolyzing) [Methanocorpusculum sp.]|nr:UDP-N-acetylglucosamine 2-epimerase (non-hydrolyzing) [Methanocorpusculum sp.]